MSDPKGGRGGGVGRLNTHNKDLIRPIQGSIVPYPPPSDPPKGPYDDDEARLQLNLVQAPQLSQEPACSCGTVATLNPKPLKPKPLNPKS